LWDKGEVLVSTQKARARLTKSFISKKVKKVKKGILVGVVIILGLMGSVAFSDEYDFRKTNWGMSEKEVGEVETATVFKYDDTICTGQFYHTSVGGFDCGIWYDYVGVGEKLVRAKYDFGYNVTDEKVCIENYEELKGGLIRKYGEPIEDKYVWIDDLYKDDPKNWGKAVSEDDLLCYVNWETPTTRITMVLKYDDSFEASLEIRYRSKELRKFEEELKEEKTLEDF